MGALHWCQILIYSTHHFFFYFTVNTISSLSVYFARKILDKVDIWHLIILLFFIWNDYADENSFVSLKNFNNITTHSKFFL